jgi:hypothetical protein
MDRLDTRQLNRATLDRQLLLGRAALPARQAVGHLAGLQAQAPLAPYVGLWTRLAGFGHDDLKDLLAERSVVRAHLMRNTVHLVTAADFLAFRPLFQPLMERALAGNFGRNLAGLDLTELRAFARVLLAERPLTRTQLAELMSPRWPDHDPAALAYAVTHLLSLVQVPPRGLWGRTGPAAFALADAWLSAPESDPPDRARAGGPSSAPDPARAGGPSSPPDPARAGGPSSPPDPARAGGPSSPPDPAGPDGRSAPPDPARAMEQLVLRYLAAYGPASVADMRAWSGLTRLREVADRLGPRLRRFTGPGGTELLDLPDAARPGADLPAPPRFLPEYDNLLLSFADRSRVIRDGRPVPLPPGNGATTGTLLVDGFWQADWTISRERDRATLEIRPFGPFGSRGRIGPFGLAWREAITAEGGRLLEFAAPASAHDIRINPVS